MVQFGSTEDESGLRFCLDAVEQIALSDDKSREGRKWCQHWQGQHSGSQHVCNWSYRSAQQTDNKDLGMLRSRNYRAIIQVSFSIYNN